MFLNVINIYNYIVNGHKPHIKCDSHNVRFNSARYFLDFYLGSNLSLF